MSDFVQQISDPFANMTGMSKVYSYPLVLFVIMMLLMMLVLMCSKPGFIYRTDSDGKRRICLGKVTGWSMVAAACLVALYYLLLQLMK